MPRTGGQVVWVTGASRGIGAAVAEAFAYQGACVVLSGRNRAALARGAARIRAEGGKAVALACDVTSERSVKHAFEEIVRKFRNIDVLVNNAGVTSFASFEKTSIAEFDRIVATNLRGTFLCTKSVLSTMLRRKNGSIINIISVSAIATFTNSSAYASTKAGVLAMSRGLRAEVRDKGIRVINVLPGAVETQMWPEKIRKERKEEMMKVDDVANIILSVFNQPAGVLTEEIIIRPRGGDL